MRAANLFFEIIFIIFIMFMPFPFLPVPTPRPCRPSARSLLAMLIAWIVPRQGIGGSIHRGLPSEIPADDWLASPLSPAARWYYLRRFATVWKIWPWWR